MTFEVSGDLMATAVCHCAHCQRQSGGAFSVNLVVHESQLTVSGTLSTYEERGENGDDVYVRRRFCAGCGSPIVSELAKSQGVVAVKAAMHLLGLVPTPAVRLPLVTPDEAETADLRGALVAAGLL